MNDTNYMRIEFPSLAENEKFARVVISAFAAQLNPTVQELDDIKTAVSEAVTNAIIHGYENRQSGVVAMSAQVNHSGIITIMISDKGTGIEDIHQAMEPFYTSKPELERSGMGFAVMQSFMDTLEVNSKPGEGTTIVMKKRIMNPEFTK